MQSLALVQNVDVVLKHTSSECVLTFHGILGSNSLSLHTIDTQAKCFIHKTPAHISLFPTDSSAQTRAFIRTLASLIAQHMHGVSRGFVVQLDLVGVGYKAEMLDASTLDLKIGKSHPVHFSVDPSVKVLVPKPTTICVYGIDKQKVSQVAAAIRSFQPLEPYKGKGIHYKGETIQRKEGKKK